VFFNAQKHLQTVVFPKCKITEKTSDTMSFAFFVNDISYL